VTLKPGLGSLKVIENDTIGSDTHDFLLTFHSSHRLISYRFRENRRFPSKIANFPTARVFSAPAEGAPLGIGYRCKGSKSSNDGATRWSKIGLVV